ncbi:alpha-ketoglutarate-dependent dioxygenase AlkB [Vibrio sp. 404]|uniref:Alpha-ketoglutarate-dependent dioxygenase AlkB n=1 Tax=Vibrio marinisediminis TaxID=2758441 RepID=A0A7W2FMT7_9VIBR|nr:alpha-ketoglutarate-dependent dioxygenase AlkB [Vibrio marinisediminis]MBA5760997.1 alpha-ketoglutarate-dependent dioxygenase AlkB [Vibrio marinisediminis]
MVAFPQWQNIEHGKVLYLEGFLSQQEADKLYHFMYNKMPWRQESIVLFGRDVLQPRLQAWFSEHAYQYSGLLLQPNPMPQPISALKTKCEQICGQTFNSVLLNLYRDGQDYMGWHQDNEKELGHSPIIASISLGAERKFTLKHKDNKQKLDYKLSHGSLFVMAGEIQHYWKHALPKTKLVSEPRVNLTFRYIKGN